MAGLRVCLALAATLVGQRVAAEPAPAPTPPPEAANAPPEPSGSAPAPPSDSAPDPSPAPSAPAPATPPAPPGYFVEGPTAGVIEPPIPGSGPIVEPPPPPVTRHVAPRTALWAGIRAGWFLPFGSLYARALPTGPDGVTLLEPVPWREFASSGLVLEADIGARIARSYMVFALWERAQLGGGRSSTYGPQAGADTDYFAGALRATSNPDRLGLITEIAIGYRQARTRFEDGGKLELTGAAFEGRLGVGADIRFTPWFTLSPLATIGVGAFDRVRRVLPNGAGYDVLGMRDASDSHAWFTLTVGGHVDLLGTR
jgi:hypothetical protein